MLTMRCVDSDPLHHGSIKIESQPDLFTRFVITLPVFNPNIESKRLSLLRS
jgi:hypothetical protein